MALVLGNSVHRAQCLQTQQQQAPVLPCSGTRRDLGPRRGNVKGSALWNVYQRERGRGHGSEPSAEWQEAHEEDALRSHSFFPGVQQHQQHHQPHEQMPQGKEQGIEGAWKQLLTQLQLPDGMKRRNTTIAGLRAQRHSGRSVLAPRQQPPFSIFTCSF
eukprot:1160080-Pelagomonas_calceolata.AAC.1